MLYYIFNMTNLFRLIFYTPVIFIGSIIGSVTYDYITFKENNNNKKLEFISNIISKFDRFEYFCLFIIIFIFF